MPDPEVSPKESFSTTFGQALAREAAQNSRICAITAAMKYGTGLQFFSHSAPERFFDVGWQAALRALHGLAVGHTAVGCALLHISAALFGWILRE